MSDTPLDARKFTDREVRAILKKAVEKTPSRALESGTGLSLAELKTIGEEVGIDPERLEEAARSVVAHGSQREGGLWGGPRVLNLERRIPGEFPAEDAPEILAIIRRAMGHQGSTQEIQGSLEWSATNETISRYVTLSAKDGETTIRTSSNLTGLATVSFLPVGALGSIFTIAGLAHFIRNGDPFGLVVGLTLLPVLFLIVRKVFGMVGRNEAAKLEQVMEELTKLPMPSEEPEKP